MAGQLLVVTGTGTGVGKTVATAALAARALRSGQRVCVIKPVQTGHPGLAGAPGPDQDGNDPDLLAIRAVLEEWGVDQRGLHAQEYLRLPAAMAPVAAARRASVSLPPLAEHAARVAVARTRHDLVLVEGAGGVAVQWDAHGGTLLDLAACLPAAQLVVCTGTHLGTLNETQLTVAAIRRAGLALAGLIVGRWPQHADAVHRDNLRDLPLVCRTEVLAVIASTEDGRPADATWWDASSAPSGPRRSAH